MGPANRPDPQAQKRALIAALNEHRVNTIGELRRVERLFATLGSSDVTQPMTAAWMHYVNSNSLLSELRGLTPNYPFRYAAVSPSSPSSPLLPLIIDRVPSSECLEEAKRRVHQDPASNRSWNYCWLVLAKVQNERLIPTFARVQASRPEMWGGRTPQAEAIEKLSQAFVNEWNTALAQLLRYWEAPPTR
ncbi:uncharacterized protein LTR77_000315 [Saxophila tyrrhenica]|uniref:Uncharacterized protein n=1 Tax=Saxophila tyrrhenica TaxID=1690608 RepID=A0AAV9PS65_9PEZI|nr:hypothetical protein LTR77_000315 [Saxophila tyrrhenica]